MEKSKTDRIVGDDLFLSQIVYQTDDFIFVSDCISNKYGSVNLLKGRQQSDRREGLQVEWKKVDSDSPVELLSFISMNNLGISEYNC